MKLYSIDFIEKIIDVYEKEKISFRKLAERFDVAKSFIQKLLKQYRETGDISPKPSGGSPPPKLNEVSKFYSTQSLKIGNHKVSNFITGKDKNLCKARRRLSNLM